MMRWRIPRTAQILVTGIALLLAPLTAQAGDLSQVKLALHAVGSPSKDPCGADAPSGFGCSRLNYPGNLTVQWPADGTPAYVYVLALDIPPTVGLAGATFGMTYTGGAFPASWNRCSTYDFHGPDWPASGSGITVTFDPCQDTVDPTDPEGEAFAILGYITMGAYSAGAAQVIHHPNSPPWQITVADCSAAESLLNESWCQGKIGFGTESGWNACFTCPDPVATSTWGAVKKTMASQP